MDKQCNRAVRELVYDKANSVLKDFLLINEPKVTKLSEVYRLAKVNSCLFVYLFVVVMIYSIFRLHT